MTQTIETRRVVITGIGIVSCIGVNPEQVLHSLQAGRSVRLMPPFYVTRG